MAGTQVPGPYPATLPGAPAGGQVGTEQLASSHGRQVAVQPTVPQYWCLYKITTITFLILPNVFFSPYKSKKCVKYSRAEALAYSCMFWQRWSWVWVTGVAVPSTAPPLALDMSIPVSTSPECHTLSPPYVSQALSSTSQVFFLKCLTAMIAQSWPSVLSATKRIIFPSSSLSQSLLLVSTLFITAKQSVLIFTQTLNCFGGFQRLSLQTQSH